MASAEVKSPPPGNNSQKVGTGPQQSSIDEYSELEKIVKLRELIASGQHTKYKPKLKFPSAGSLPSSKPTSKPATPPIPAIPPPKTQPIQVYTSSDDMLDASPTPAQQLAAQREQQQQKLNKLLQQRQQELAQLELQREQARREQEKRENERLERERIEKERLEREKFEREKQQQHEKEERERNERERLEKQLRMAQEQKRAQINNNNNNNNDNMGQNKEQERIALEQSVQDALDQERREQEKRKQQELAARMLPQKFSRRRTQSQTQVPAPAGASASASSIATQSQNIPQTQTQIPQIPTPASQQPQVPLQSQPQISLPLPPPPPSQLASQFQQQFQAHSFPPQGFPPQGFPPQGFPPPPFPPQGLSQFPPPPPPPGQLPFPPPPQSWVQPGIPTNNNTVPQHQQQQQAPPPLPQPLTKQPTITPPVKQNTAINTDNKKVASEKKLESARKVVSARRPQSEADKQKAAFNAERKRLHERLAAQFEEWRTRKMRIGDPALDPSIDLGVLLENALEAVGSIPGNLALEIKDNKSPLNPVQTPSNDGISTHRASSEGLYSPPEHIQQFEERRRPSDAEGSSEEGQRRKGFGNRDAMDVEGSDNRSRKGDAASRGRDRLRKPGPNRKNNSDSSPGFSNNGSDAPSVGSTSSSIPRKRACPTDDDQKQHSCATDEAPSKGGAPADALPETIIINDDNNDDIDSRNNNNRNNNRNINNTPNNNNGPGRTDGTWQLPTVPRSRMSPKPPAPIKNEQAPDSPTMTIPRPTPTPEPPMVSRVEYLVERPRNYPREMVFYDPDVARSRGYIPAPPEGYEFVLRPKRRPEYDFSPHEYPYPSRPRYAYYEDPYYDNYPRYAPRGPPRPPPPPEYAPQNLVIRPGSPGAPPPRGQRLDSPPPSHQLRQNDALRQSSQAPLEQSRQASNEPPLQQPQPQRPPHLPPQPIADMFSPYDEDIEKRSRRMPMRRSRSPPEHSRVRYERRSRSRSPPRDIYRAPARYHPEDYRAPRPIYRRPGSPEYVKVYSESTPSRGNHMYEYNPHGGPVYVHEREPPPSARMVYYDSRRPEPRHHSEFTYYDRPPPQEVRPPPPHQPQPPHQTQQSQQQQQQQQQQRQAPSLPPSPRIPTSATASVQLPPQQQPQSTPSSGSAEQPSHRQMRYAAEPGVIPDPRVYRERDYQYPHHHAYPSHHPPHPQYPPSPHDPYDRVEVPRPDPRYVRSAAAPPREYYTGEVPPEGRPYRPSGHEPMPGRYYSSMP